MPARPEMTLPELSQFATELEDPMLVDNVFPEQPPPPFFFFSYAQGYRTSVV